MQIGYTPLKREVELKEVAHTRASQSNCLPWPKWVVGSIVIILSVRLPIRVIGVARLHNGRAEADFPLANGCGKSHARSCGRRELLTPQLDEIE